MKSGKYKFSSDSAADCVARQYLLELYLGQVGRLIYSIWIPKTKNYDKSRNILK